MGLSDRNEERCPRCRGGALQGYQDCDGPCDGSGYVCMCLHCGTLISAPEAESEGQYCATCRVMLDHPEPVEADEAAE